MKRKNITWLVVSCLMVVALLLASCAPAVVEEKKVTPPVAKEVAPPVKEKEVVVPGKEVVPEGFVKWRGVKLDGTVVEKMMEKPRYGGVLTLTSTSTAAHFDGAFGGGTPPAQSNHTGERIISVDWTRGPAGTGELFFGPYEAPSLEAIGNSVAGSLEMPDPNTMVIHLRKGIHWHNKPPTSGREFVADDILFSFERLWQSPLSYQYTNVPKATFVESVTAPDKYTVVLKAKPGKLAELYEIMLGYVDMASREAVEKYGNLNDWRNAVGLGPYMLVDYVSASSFTCVRNPNYWDVDPFFPENQLPYPDGVKTLIIPDISTKNAALRTGKIDVVCGTALPDTVSWEDWEMFKKTNPELKYRGTLGRPPSIMMRFDTKPFDDIRVRQALMLAIDHQEIKDYYYGGHAEIAAWPAAPIPDQADWFIPLKELPPQVRELYSYNPEKARRLLAEAGYPNGFQTEIVTKSGWVDDNTLIKAYWAKIGVDLSINVVDDTSYSNIGNQRKHKAMFAYQVAYNRPWTFQFLAAGKLRNYGMVNDPVIQEAYNKVGAAFFDDPLRKRLMKEIVPYIIEQAYIIVPPTPYNYNMWWPWVKGYSGEDSLGFMQQLKWTKYVWIDQEMKKAMGR